MPFSFNVSNVQISVLPRDLSSASVSNYRLVFFGIFMNNIQGLVDLVCFVKA